MINNDNNNRIFAIISYPDVKITKETLWNKKNSLIYSDDYFSS